MIHFLLTLLFSPLLRLALRSPGKGRRRVLLIQTAKIGDLVASLPLIASLRASLPGCHLTVMASPAAAPLLAHDPAVDEVWPLPAGAWKGWKGKWRLAARLRRGRFDDCICLSPNLAFLLLPYWAGIPRRGAILPDFESRTSERCARFLTHAERHRAGRLVLETGLELLARMGCDRLIRRSRAHAAPGATERVEAFLGARRAPRIGIGVSSGNKLKALSAGQLARTCALLLEALPHDLVLIGGSEDRHVAREVRALCGESGRLIDATGAFELDVLPALMPALEAYLGVDSGITYLADSLEVPTVDLMGPADAGDQRPLGARVIVLRSELPCAPCSHAFRAPYDCARGDRACITRVEAATLARAVTEVLAARRGGT
ncbi:MAG: glycosyltransferase family 9 protein [Burkholderiales bacterium]|nr:glycosyltransferase family 9 protein [Burkholderiales bacterium]